MTNENCSLWDIKRLAAHLDVSPRTIDDLWKKGELPKPIYIGRQKRWYPEIIEAFIKDEAAKATKEQKRRLTLLSS